MFKLLSLVITILPIVFASSLDAKELAGIKIEEVVNLSTGGESLRLQGAAVRNGAHQSVYIGGLYLQQPAHSVEEILSDEGAKRFVLICQNTEIKPDALIRAFNLGITANHSEDELLKLQPQIKVFNQIWNDEIRQGDQVWIDFIPEKGTIVTINGEQKAPIPGKPFYDAFLKTWLGDKPINPEMKKQLLGES